MPGQKEWQRQGPSARRAVDSKQGNWRTRATRRKKKCQLHRENAIWDPTEGNTCLGLRAIQEGSLLGMSWQAGCRGKRERCSSWAIACAGNSLASLSHLASPCLADDAISCYR